jgi:hypothetical protein
MNSNGYRRAGFIPHGCKQSWVIVSFGDAGGASWLRRRAAGAG